MTHEIEAESYVIGGMLSNYVFAVEATETLSVSDYSDAFAGDCHAVISNRIKQKDPISIDVLSLALKERYSDALKRLISIDAITRGGCDYRSYLREVKDLSLRRQLIDSTRRLAIDATDVNFITEELITRVIQTGIKLELRGNADSVLVGQELLKDYIGRGCVLSKHEYVLSGFPALDGMTKGFPEGTLTYLGARTSMGKTTLMIQMMIEALSTGHSVAFMSFEMTPITVMTKALCLMAKVNYRMATDLGILDSERMKMVKAYDSGLLSNLFLSEKRMTISQVKSWIRRQVSQRKVKIVFIDYLTLIKPDHHMTSKHGEVDSISKGLQDIAKELKVPIVCAAQLNRRIATGKDNRPTIGDFRESGSIEEDADICLLLHRNDYYDAMSRPRLADLIVAKNRLYGTLGNVELSWNDGLYVSGYQRCVPVFGSYEKNDN